MRQSLRTIFAWPLAVAVITLVGLVAALVGDGVWDALSWATLAIPVGLYAYHYRRARPR